MKKIYLVMLIALGCLSVTSCNKWLDVMPEDQVDAEDLFKEGSGYRNALNGVYRQLSSSGLYGKELTYGMAEALAQVYNSGSMHSQSVHLSFMKYDYTIERSKNVIKSTWDGAYSAIANSNSIIVNIANEPDSKFKKGKMEKELILGEALALRAFLHFQILCYFAPAPVTKSTGTWVPYYDTFPQTSASYLTVDMCIARCIEDLKAAKEYIRPFDTYESGYSTNRKKLHHKNRFFVPPDYAHAPEEELFFNYRGFRINYLAVTAILARVYNYSGELDLAATEAQEVIDFKLTSTHSDPVLYFTPEETVDADYKRTPDLIFCVGDEELLTIYSNAMASQASYVLSLNRDYSSLFDAASDYRKTKLLNVSGRSIYPICYTTPKRIDRNTLTTLEILPVIRLSEMYYIKAEALARQADFVGATAALDKVREGRSCPVGMLIINSAASFKKEILREARREFIQEGMTFYYHKKYNEKFIPSMTDKMWYLPYPDSENVN